jgi:uncharacterized protein (DUF433 family)
MLTTTRYEHIALDAQGNPIIIGTTLKVKELAAERLAWGWSPEELLIHHPGLTLGQVFSALAYYADHQSDIEQELQADLEWAEALHRRSPEPPLVTRLKAQGLA